MICKSISVFVIMSSLLILTSNCHWQKYNNNKQEKRKSSYSCTEENIKDDVNAIEKPVDPSRDTNDDTSYDPCEIYNPPVPDFMKPGKRISVAKCEEYQWKMKVRKENAERDKECKSKGLLNLLNYEETDNATNIVKRQVEQNDTTADSEENDDFHHLVPTLYVIGGQDTLPMEYPHMGAIGWESSYEDQKWKFMCGSTLISPDFVLTAAHCTKADSRDTTIVDTVPRVVRFGVETLISFNMQKPPVDRIIKKIITHPQYASPKKYFDIALIKLRLPVTFTKYVQPACLWNGDHSQLKEATVTGWGATDPRSHRGHSHLQEASLHLIDTELCDGLLRPSCSRLWCGIQDHQFCAGQLDGGVDSCEGDSGGPLQTKIPLPPNLKSEGSMHYVIGVVSFGIGCGKKDLPGVYTKVSYFVDWIESVVWA